MYLDDFLANNQPSSLTVDALWYLHHFFHHKTWESGLSFETLLRQHHLDYSLKSLNRVDKLLDTIRHSVHPVANEFIDDIANRDFLYLVAFYSGEVLGRAKNQAVIWENDEQSATLEFSSLLTCRYQDNGLDIKFRPLSIIYKRLFNVDKEASLYNEVHKHLDNSLLDVTQKLCKSPIHFLNFTGKQALEITPLSHLAYLQMLPPHWIKDDDLQRQLLDLPNLYEHGRVVWGAIVQANNMLFEEDNTAACPAEIIYDRSGRTDPITLSRMAYSLFDLKDDENNPENINETESIELNTYAEHLKDENTRLWQRIKTIEHIPIYSATILVWPLHLPNGVLSQSIFPILISDDTKTAMILPARYWSHTAFYQQWISESENPEIAPSFIRLLDKKSSFWQRYRWQVQPESRRLPSLGKYPVVYSRSKEITENNIAQQFVEQYKLESIREVRADYASYLVIGVILTVLFVLIFI